MTQNQSTFKESDGSTENMLIFDPDLALQALKSSPSDISEYELEMIKVLLRDITWYEHVF